MMKIQVSTIPPEGLQRLASYDPTTMDMDRSDVRLKEPFEVDAFITKVDRELVVDVEIRAPLHLSCGRCLEGFPWTVRTDALLSYRVQPADIVDITDDIRQEVILAYPTVPLCQPGCKGLCPSCGQDLNVASCAHQRSPVKPHQE
ncbi:MAG: DUF177 domain-containing protein [Candidatus Omnitrophica bacterium]|nr:DUF177 domain-containing protein [Candidatus Omnitrophota bacterium]